MFEKTGTYKDTNYSKTQNDFLKRLKKSLSGDLNFHNENGNNLSHNFHSFPAKFPPQIPKKFILELTEENDLVLDPMMGSGTTILEAIANKRQAAGFDIDPLALLISSVKTTNYNKKILIDEFNKIIDDTTYLIKNNETLLSGIYNNFDPETRNFIEYWFHKETIKELLALSHSISLIKSLKIQNFFKVIFSSIIITKSGGVSLAMDLAHTRPHKAKTIIEAYSNNNFFSIDKNNHKGKSYNTKRLKNSISEFQKKFYQNIETVITDKEVNVPKLSLINSKNIKLEDNSVDLIVTSPPYAANAIDYMRAHKFSLLWFGYSINNLKLKRKEYISHEAVSDFTFEKMPSFTDKIIKEIDKKNNKKSKSLLRYFSEMSRVLKEMYRVLKPNSASIVVVGNSTICGIEVRTDLCLKEIGELNGFVVPKIGERDLDRNRRMLPASNNKNYNSQILNRMHKEYILGFYKK